MSKKNKLKEGAADTDSIFSRMMNKKKSGAQGSGEEIQRKLGIVDTGYQFGNRPGLSLKRIFQYMLDKTGIEEPEEPIDTEKEVESEKKPEEEKDEE